MKTFICDRSGKTTTVGEFTHIRKDYPNAYQVIDFDLVDWWNRGE